MLNDAKWHSVVKSAYLAFGLVVVSGLQSYQVYWLTDYRNLLHPDVYHRMLPWLQKLHLRLLTRKHQMYRHRDQLEDRNKSKNKGRVWNGISNRWFDDNESRICIRVSLTDEYGDIVPGLLGLMVESVGNCRCSWFIDDSHHVHSRDSTGIFSRLTLSIIEISWYSDHRIVHCLAKISFSCPTSDTTKKRKRRCKKEFKGNFALVVDY